MTAPTAVRARSAVGHGSLIALVGGSLVVVVALAPVQLTLVALAAAIALVLVVMPRYDAALLLVVLLGVTALIPAPLTVAALRSIGAPTILLGLAAAAAFFVTWIAPSDEPRRPFRPIPIVVVAFVGANLASYASAAMRGSDLVEVNAADRGMITVIASAGIALLGAEAISSRERLDRVLQAAALAGAVIAAIGILQFAIAFDVASTIRVPGLSDNGEGVAFITERSIFRRISGTTMHAIEFSVALCMLLPIALHLAMHRSRWWYVAVGTMAVALPMSVSRTAVLGAVAIVVALVPSWPQRIRRRFYIGVAIYLVGVRILVPGLLGTIRALFKDAGADPSVESRRTDYEFVQGFVSERPWFGRGFATFIPTRYDFLDNQYLLSLVETGLVGAAAFLVMVSGGMVVASHVAERGIDASDRNLAQSLVASLTVVLATCLAFDFLSFPTVRVLLFVILGCVGALWRLAPYRRTTRPDVGRFQHAS